MKLHIYDTLWVSHAMYIKYTLKGHSCLNVLGFPYLFSIITYLLQFLFPSLKSKPERMFTSTTKFSALGPKK